MRKQKNEAFLRIPVDGIDLEANLTLPESVSGVVLFAHGSESSRHSPRNNFIADEIQRAGIGTLLVNLLTSEEEEQEALPAGDLKFNFHFLAKRLASVTCWLLKQNENLPVGYFGSGMGAAAAFIAGPLHAGHVKAIVARGGRPDLAGASLKKVKAASLLITGALDNHPEFNQFALRDLGADEKKIKVVPGATLLYEDQSTLDEVTHLAVDWFTYYLGGDKIAHSQAA